MVHKLQLYPDGKLWRFDDSSRKLLAEPFVSGTPELLTLIRNSLKITSKELVVFFSDDSFFGADIVVHQVEVEMKDKNGKVVPQKYGAWYGLIITLEDGTKQQMTGWLCPATLRYFDNYPEMIYIRMENAPVTTITRSLVIRSHIITRAVASFLSTWFIKLRLLFPIDYETGAEDEENHS